jgi:hypothetical protein
MQYRAHPNGKSMPVELLGTFADGKSRRAIRVGKSFRRDRVWKIGPYTTESLPPYSHFWLSLTITERCALVFPRLAPELACEVRCRRRAYLKPHRRFWVR